jgi:hypothetical protein
MPAVLHPEALFTVASAPSAGPTSGAMSPPASAPNVVGRPTFRSAIAKMDLVRLAIFFIFQSIFYHFGQSLDFRPSCKEGQILYRDTREQNVEIVAMNMTTQRSF